MPIISDDIDRGILPGRSKTILFKPLSGLFMQEKLIPLRHCSITIELEIVNNLYDPIVSQASVESLPPTLDGEAFPSNFKSITDNSFSTQWRIENAQLRLQLQPTSYLRLEMAACKAFVNKMTRTNGSDNSNDEEGIFGTGRDS
jgi:hypothetical protein